MELREINNKDEWEGLLHNCIEKTFLQSWNWGEFNIAMKSPSNQPGKVWRFGFYFKSKLIAGALTIKVSAKRGTFLFVPHGPVIIEGLSMKDKEEILEIFLARLRELAKSEKASFIRISPLLERNDANIKMFQELGFREAPIHASAYEATWRLDICPEEELLKNMRKTTRYLIKKTGENPDISIEKTADSNKISIYQDLNKKVSQRQKFVPFSDEFIKNEFETFAKDNQALFLFGKYKGEVVAGAMVIFWSGIGFYHQAASLGRYSKLSIPYLLQWEAILEAIKRECVIYDFWGFTDPVKFPKHPWAGPTLFKMGFGGYPKEFVKTQDFIISKKYWLNYIIEKIRKIIRRL